MELVKRKLCPNCGKYNEKTANNCANCGVGIIDVDPVKVDASLEFAPKEEAEETPEEAAEEPAPAAPEAPKAIEVECYTCGHVFTTDKDGRIHCPQCTYVISVERARKKFLEKGEEPVVEAKAEEPKSRHIFFRFGEASYPFDLTNEHIVFGRNSIPCPSFNENRYISRKHLELWIEGGKIYAKCLFEGGILINGSSVSNGKTIELKSGDVLGFYKAELRLLA